jgi:hypothetical protein
MPIPQEIEAKIYLEKLDISTSDGKGIGTPTLKIRAMRSLPPPKMPLWYEAKVTSYKTSKLLFTIESLHLDTSPTTKGFNIKFLIELHENDPTYPDSVKFEGYYEIPYKLDEMPYGGSFEFTHSADLNEGAVRKIIRTIFTFKFKYEVNVALNQIEIALYNLRNPIKKAGSQSRYPDVTPEMIAAVMYDEILFEDILDQFQNSGGQISLNDNDFAKSFGRFLVTSSVLFLKPLDEVSIGIAQMQLRRFKNLVNEGYINPPPKWDKDPTEATIKFLLNPEKAPYAVGAELQRIVDFWQKGGVDISKNYPVLLYLYTVGTTTPKGVNPNPQPDPEGAGKRKASYMSRLKNILK